MFRSIAAAAAAVLVACVVVALAPSPAAAAPVVYYESFHGELVHNQNPLTTFTFAAGVNSVDGMLSYSDFDAFAFVVPAGHALAGGRVVLFNGGPVLNERITAVDWTFNAGSTSPGGGSFIQYIHGVPDAPATTIPASPAGTYNVSAYGMGGTGGTPNVVYRFTFDVQPVPEPASLALLGLGGLALLRRRRRRR